MMRLLAVGCTESPSASRSAVASISASAPSSCSSSRSRSSTTRFARARLRMMPTWVSRNSQSVVGTVISSAEPAPFERMGTVGGLSSIVAVER